MSKLEQLINELCPDGVEYKKIKEIAEVGTGGSNGNEAIENGKYPFFIRSQTVKSKDDWEYDEEALIIPGEGGIGEIYHYVNEKYAIHQRVYRIHFTTEIVNVKFAFYYFSSCFKAFILQKAVSATVTSIRKPMIEDFFIPLPPLPVQAEIVRILDNFTELTAELTAELIARKKQYEYYRDSLLTFGDEVMEWKELGSFGKVNMCKRILKEQTLDIGGVPFYKIGTFGKESNAYIPRELFDEYRSKYSYPKIGEVLISASGTIGRTVIFNGQDAYFQDSNIVWIENDETQVLNKYLFYSYKIAKWGISQGGTIQRLYNDNLKKTKIPIPYPNDSTKSLKEQQRIVEILDRFDTLCNDITQGLPSEIEARKKQYEYYRDKLLTFPKAKLEV